MKKSVLTVAACVLPVLLVVMSIVRAEISRASQPVFRLPISGYDPRDLLRGRFLQFRFDVPALESQCAQPPCCLCPAGEAVVATTHSCHHLDAQCSERAVPSEELRGQQRFYIAESRAAELERELIESARHGEAAAVFVLDPDQRPQFIRLELGEFVIEALGD